MVRRARILAGVFAAAWLAFGTEPSPAATPPDCPYGLEPGGGPMRCADPKNPDSAASLRHPFFVFMQLAVPDRKEQFEGAICWMIRPNEYMHGVMRGSFDTHNNPWGLQPYYGLATYEVHLKERRFTLIDASPNAPARGGEHEKRFDKDFRIYDVPQAGWPCTLKTWSDLLVNAEVPVDAVPDRRYPTTFGR